MKAVLICPSERPGVAYLAQSLPLVNLPLLGEPFLHHWFEFLAASGVGEALLVATDRPDQVRALAGNGRRWGMRLALQAALQEPSMDEAETSFGTSPNTRVILLDHLPGLAGTKLFSSYHHWFGAAQEWLFHSPKQNRVGFREIAPAVWVGRDTHIEANVHLEGPCWIGEQVRIGNSARIGPSAILENRILVESQAEIKQSIVGPDTFVGSLTRISDSIAWGSNLINWKTGSCLEVPDSFLLCPLRQFAFLERARPFFQFWRHLTDGFRFSPRAPRRTRETR